MTASFLSIVGARPNFIKLPPIHKALVNKNLKHIIVHTGQHYDYQMSQVFFENLKIPPPDFNLEVGSGNPGFQLGEMIKKCENILIQETPKVVLVYGDTNSTLAGALASVKLGIPVAHIEAGLRSFDRKMPEEINRVLTDHISNDLFCPTLAAKKNLKRENVFGQTYYVGDVMVDTLKEYGPLFQKSSILDKLGIEPKKYLLLTIHRAENTEDPNKLVQIVRSLDKIAKRVIFPIHPRTNKFLKKYSLFETLLKNPNIIITEPLSYLDFIKLAYNSEKILTDSGGVQKEAYLLGIPCITLRENTEWIETLHSGWNILVGVDEKRIQYAIKEFEPTSLQIPLFGIGNAGLQIAEILAERYT